jgi:ribosomal protein S12 methylthiotransferase
VDDLLWIRLLYSYPNFLDPDLLGLIAASDKICKYIDIPFQHISPRLLQRMRRGKSGSAVRETVEKLRQAIPGLTLRTSIIVGFPGETDEEFAELLDFVEATEFDRLGVFKYSEEEGTSAARLDGKVSEQEKENRWQEVMDIQAAVSRKKNQALIGTIQRVMIGAVDPDTGQFTGRTAAHAPEVDGVVYIDKDNFEGERPPHAGDMLLVKITGASEYDLIGETLHG